MSIRKHKRLKGGTRKSRMKCNSPVKSWRPGKKRAVKACSGGREKIIHFGATGYGHNYSNAARRSFRARHRCSSAKDKMSARYWACKKLWAGPGGSTKRSPPGRRAKLDKRKSKRKSKRKRKSKSKSKRKSNILGGRCWKGYEPTPGVKAYAKGSCRKRLGGGDKTWNVKDLRELVYDIGRNSEDINSIRAAEDARKGEWANDKTLEILANAFDVCIFVYQTPYIDQWGDPSGFPYWNEIGYGDCKNKQAIFMHGNGNHFQILRPTTISRAEAALEASNASISNVDILSPEGQRQIQDVLKLFTLVDVPGDGDCGYHAFARQLDTSPSPSQSPPSGGKKCKGKAPKGKICNPKTGRWVKRNGEIGRQILANQSPSPPQSPSQSPPSSPSGCKGRAPKGKICNPKTGRWVKRDGEIGRQLSRKSRKSKNAKSPINCRQFRKTKSPKCNDQPGCKWLVGVGCVSALQQTFG